MAATLSGLPVLRPDSLLLRTATIPGTSKRLRAGSWWLPVLLDLARRWQAHPDLGGGRLNLDAPGALHGSYAFREARAASAYSDHCGWAMDLCYQILKPDNRRHMTARETAAVESLLKDYGGLVSWGGHYRRLIDEMHFYPTPGVTRAKVDALRTRLGINDDGTRTARLKPVVSLSRLGRGKPASEDVKRVQRHLRRYVRPKLKVTGRWDRPTRLAWAAAVVKSGGKRRLELLRHLADLYGQVTAAP
jgi:hypothetical protein